MSHPLSQRGDEDDDEEGWEEELEEECLNLRCLFCTNICQSLSATVLHMQSAHDFDLQSEVRQLGICDDYEFIRMINFIRKEVADGRNVHQRLNERNWSNNDAFLVPVDPEDGFLTLDLDEVLGGERRSTAQTVEERLRKTEDALNEAKHELDAMRRCMRRIVAEDAGDPLPRIPNGPVSHESDDDDDDELPPALVQSAQPTPPSSQNPSVIVFPRTSTRTPVLGDAYFESYDRPSIHEEMLLDSVRTESYLNFIRGNSERLFSGRRVLDLGCGTGILSMAAARAGAQEVLAVDRSDIIFTAMDIARENNLHDKITFHHGRIEDIYHELGQIDIVISEWMGYFLLFESMLDSVLFCRERLNPNHGIFPRFYSLRVVGLNDPVIAKEKVEGWDDFYGFKMSALRRQIMHEACVKTCSPSTVATTSCQLSEIDLSSCGLDWQLLNSQIKLEVNSSTATRITAIAGYFDVQFESSDRCDRQVEFSTGPIATPTHWKQTVFVLQEPLSVQYGEALTGELSVRRSQTDMRSLSVDLSLTNASGSTTHQQYTMD